MCFSQSLFKQATQPVPKVVNVFAAHEMHLKKLHRARRNSINNHNDKQLNAALYELGIAHRENKHSIDSAVYYFRQSLRLATSRKDHDKMGFSHYQIGDIYFNSGNFDSTIFYYLKTQTDFKHINPYMYAHSYSYIGDLYFTFEAYKSALNYYRKSLALKQRISAKEANIPFAYWCIAEAHYSLSNQDSALYYYRLSSSVATTTRNIPYYGNEGIAQIKINQHQYDSALIYLKPIPKWYFEANVPKWIADMGLLYMEVYAHKKDGRNFNYWREITRKNAFSTFLPEQRRKYYKCVSGYFYQLHRVDSAYHYLKLENQEWNTITRLKARSNIDALIEAYNSLKQRSELLYLNSALKENQLDKRAINLENERLSYQNNLFSILVTAAIVVLLLLLAIIGLIYRQKQKTKQKTVLLQQANRDITEKMKQLNEKEFRIREMQMASEHLFAILDEQLRIKECNDSFVQTMPYPVSVNSSFELTLGTNHFPGLNDLIRSAQPYESKTFRCRWDDDQFLAIDFSIINLTEDLTVKGYVLEGKNVTEQLASQVMETNLLIHELNEKEQQIFQVNKEAALSNLQLDLSRQTLHELSIKLENNLPKEARMQELRNLVQQGIQSDKYWDNFMRHFDIAHQQFFKKLKHHHPDLTINEEKHCAFLKIKLSNKEVSVILGVAPDTVKKARQRLKKKLHLQIADSLKHYIESF
ncbi:MAG: hypothetical protein A3E30_03480 [Fluviicola sp. RIFCSPHIGHO2_12_FULL_43_24]|nr:MAG: hypothetical protein A3E30_03480 [Fluviicola sp. RIFCSPHIGHO2_12_FULL_43_24]